jgi:hypothetical protein
MLFLMQKFSLPLQVENSSNNKVGVGSKVGSNLVKDAIEKSQKDTIERCQEQHLTELIKR